MSTTGTDVVRSVVCVSAHHMGELCKAGWTASDAIWEAVSPRDYVLDGSQDRTNSFAAARGDKSAMRHIAKLLWTGHLSTSFLLMIRSTNTPRNKQTSICQSSHNICVMKLTDFAYLTIAPAIGCSLQDSAVPTIARRRRKAWVDLSAVCSRTCAMCGTPYVTVPVLSNTTVFTWWQNSNSRCSHYRQHPLRTLQAL